MKKYGVYNAEIESDMTIKGITNKSTEKGTITVEGKKITVDANEITKTFHKTGLGTKTQTIRWESLGTTSALAKQ